ncbi:hypothetical protein BDV40DRAFT_307081 [Aspergillus tamarii]|uniref:Uncharacterized protein n=1 Tax=Aspergillus tamarii TaxID=41984 RepID=A0A5N6U9X6_ASPTM|nr:hypothetical protein BDV40DRAFT_307081 [Aspergillus tamarii]
MSYITPYTPPDARPLRGGVSSKMLSLASNGLDTGQPSSAGQKAALVERNGDVNIRESLGVRPGRNRLRE